MKTIDIIKENAITIATGKLVKPLTKDNFKTDSAFAEYKLLVDNLQKYLYNNSIGKKAKEKNSKKIYVKTILNTLQATAEEQKAVLDRLTVTDTVVCGENRRVMTPESKAELRKLTAAKAKIEAKNITETYTIKDKETDLSQAQYDIDYFKKNQATYTTDLYRQKSDTAFRLALESAIGYALIGNNDAADYKDSKQRADTAKWLRWIEKAKALSIDVEPFKAAVDFEGLKAAVQAAYKAKEQEVLAKAIEQAKAEMTADKAK